MTARADTLSFMGYAIRYTDCIYGRHLYVLDGTLWLGTQGVLANVLAHVARGDLRITDRLIELMRESEQRRCSVEWTP